MENLENDTIEETQEDNATQDNAPQGQTQAAKEKRAWEFKVNKEVRKMELDDDEVKVLAQKGLAGDEKLREAAAIRKEAEKMKQEAEAQRAELNAFYKAVRENPRAALKKHPELKDLNWLEFSEEELLEHITESQKDPKDKELEELRRYKLEQEEARNKTEAQKKQEEEAKQNEIKERMILNTVSKKFTEVLQGEGSHLPNDPRTVARMAYYAMGAIQHGKPLDPAVMAKAVEDDYKKDFEHFAKNATADQIIGIIGEEAFKKMKMADIEKIKKLGTTPAQKIQQTTSQPRQAKSKYKNIEEAREKEFGSRYVFPDDY